MPDVVSGIMSAASVGSGIANIFGASSAADAQKAAADKAAAATLEQQAKGLAAQKDYFNIGADTLKPIASQGSDVYASLVKQLPDLTAPIVVDQTALEKTPGYQFTRDQGIRGVDLSSAAKGLSGAQAKAAATFATNLANQTYLDQFNIANTNKTNAFNRLLQTATVGTDAAKSLAGNATSAGNAALGNTQAVGNALGGYSVGAGNAQAAADLAIGKQVGNIFQGVGGAFTGNALLGGGSGMYGGTNNPTKLGTLY